MENKQIGPSFYDELIAAGVAGLPFAWAPDGTITFDAAMTLSQKATVEAVYAAHDPAKPSWSAYQGQARAALTDSDITLLRCAECGVSVPPTWAAYRKALRAIVSAVTGDPAQPLPIKPAYPTGT
jgi:hypothetical protein